MTLNVYNIPTDGRNTEAYFNFVSGLAITFNSDRSIFVDPNLGIVKVDGTISGYTINSTEEV